MSDLLASIQRADELNRAFNRGSDARLSGQPAAVNPFDPEVAIEIPLYRAFLSGWNDVDHHFGLDARRPMQLPLVVRQKRGRPRK